MHHLAFHLQLPVDAEQRRAEQFAALLLDQPRLDDDVGQPGFVFQRDEDDAGRRARPLAADDDAGGADQGAVAGALADPLAVMKRRSARCWRSRVSGWRRRVRPRLR